MFFEQTPIPVFLNLVDDLESFKSLEFNADEVSNGLHFHLFHRDDIFRDPKTGFVNRIFDSRVNCFLVNQEDVIEFNMPFAHAPFVKHTLIPYINKASNAMNIYEFTVPYEEASKLGLLFDFSARNNRISPIYRIALRNLELTISEELSAQYQQNQMIKQEDEEPENDTWRITTSS